MRARAQLGANGVTTVKMVITHPMLIERSDAKTGQTLPAHFIEEVTVTHNGEAVVNAAWGQAVSTNPFFEFSFLGAKQGDQVAIAWRDNRGTTDSAQFPVV
jgi:sulfur-oxidizing protein SoxZ